jgi:hypothetical protein
LSASSDAWTGSVVVSRPFLGLKKGLSSFSTSIAMLKLLSDTQTSQEKKR